MRSFRVIWALALLAGSLAAQQVVPTPTLVNNVVPPSYVVGPNDVLAMTVYGDPELASPAMRVDSDGTIRTPFGTTPVHVAGLNLDAINAAIAAELVKDQLAVNPKVDVSVVDPESHPILVTGLGIRSTGTLQAVQPLTLGQVLTRAGGVTGSNDVQITILTHAADGAVVERHFSANQVMTATDAANNPLLYGGEEVQVMPGGDAYLSGGVAAPGAYPLDDADPLTVRKALTKAHGLSAAAKGNEAQLIQHLGQPNQTTRIINLNAIINGSAPDIPLAANDMVYVPFSGGKKALQTGATTGLSLFTFVTGALLTR